MKNFILLTLAKAKQGVVSLGRAILNLEPYFGTAGISLILFAISIVLGDFLHNGFYKVYAAIYLAMQLAVVILGFLIISAVRHYERRRSFKLLSIWITGIVIAVNAASMLHSSNPYFAEFLLSFGGVGILLTLFTFVAHDHKDATVVKLVMKEFDKDKE